MTELAGSAGAKIHTARSRNDQVATDLRLWCKRELIAVARLVVALQDVLLARAEAAGDTYLPGYTHVQRAQPVLLAHHLLAHGWAFGRDVDRLVATVERLDVSPLGAGALAGTSLPIDPAATADGARLRRRVRQLARRRERPRLRRRGAVRPGARRHPPRPPRRGVGAVDERGVRLRPPRRRLRHGFVDDAAEEERRHRRAGPRQVGAADRQPHRPAGDAEGPAPGVQPRPPGGQGAAVRLRRPDLARPRRHRRDDRHGHVRARADAGGGRQRDDVGDRPRRVARRARHAVPRRPTPSSASSCGRTSPRACRCASVVAADDRLGPDAAAVLAPGVGVQRRTSPGGGGPGPVAAQFERFAASLRRQREMLGG